MSPEKPGSVSSPGASTLSIRFALLLTGTEKPVVKKALKSTTQLDSTGRFGFLAKPNTCARLASI